MTTKKTTCKTSKTAKAPKSKKATTKASKAPAPKAKTAPKAAAKPRDPSKPGVGAVLTRMFKGELIEVYVTTAGFVYDGKTFSSISAVAKHITGYMISGPVFFKLVEPKRPAAEGK